MKNVPFTKSKMEKLKDKFTPSGEFPNRKARREFFQKKTRRPIWALLKYVQIVPKSKGSVRTKKIYHYKPEFLS